jgi:hypothetical protein
MPIISSAVMFIVAYAGSLLGGVFAALFVAWRATGRSPLVKPRKYDFYRSLNDAARAAARVQSFGLILGIGAALISYRTNTRPDLITFGSVALIACVISLAISLSVNPPDPPEKPRGK